MVTERQGAMKGRKVGQLGGGQTTVYREESEQWRCNDEAEMQKDRSPGGRSDE